MAATTAAILAKMGMLAAAMVASAEAKNVASRMLMIRPRPASCICSLPLFSSDSSAFSSVSRYCVRCGFAGGRTRGAALMGGAWRMVGFQLQADQCGVQAFHNAGDPVQDHVPRERSRVHTRAEFLRRRQKEQVGGADAIHSSDEGHRD